jgi:hypothetical protein
LYAKAVFSPNIALTRLMAVGINPPSLHLAGLGASKGDCILPTFFPVFFDI